jgi:hypothetical protein
MEINSVRAVQCFVTHLWTFHELKDYMTEQQNGSERWVEKGMREVAYSGVLQLHLFTGTKGKV